MKKDIIGYENLYDIDEYGNIYDKLTHTQIKWEIYNTRGRIYKYPVVILKNNDKELRFPIHHLVADHFIPNPFQKHVVHHYDRNPMNNHISNLRRCTNTEHATYHSLGDKADEYFENLATY